MASTPNLMGSDTAGLVGGVIQQMQAAVADFPNSLRTASSNRAQGSRSSASAPRTSGRGPVVNHFDPDPVIEFVSGGALVIARLVARRPAFEDPQGEGATHKLEYFSGRAGCQWVIMDEAKKVLREHDRDQDIPYAVRVRALPKQPAAVATAHPSAALCTATRPGAALRPVARSATPSLLARSAQVSAGAAPWGGVAERQATPTPRPSCLRAAAPGHRAVGVAQPSSLLYGVSQVADRCCRRAF